MKLNSISRTSYEFGNGTSNLRFVNYCLVELCYFLLYLWQIARLLSMLIRNLKLCNRFSLKKHFWKVHSSLTLIKWRENEGNRIPFEVSERVYEAIPLTVTWWLQGLNYLSPPKCNNLQKHLVCMTMPAKTTKKPLFFFTEYILNLELKDRQPGKVDLRWHKRPFAFFLKAQKRNAKQIERHGTN